MLRWVRKYAQKFAFIQIYQSTCKKLWDYLRVDRIFYQPSEYLYIKQT